MTPTSPALLWPVGPPCLTHGRAHILPPPTYSATHWAVNFYATWCGHCVHLAPHWKRAALRLADDADVELGAVNCAVEQQLCQRHGVQSFPTIKFFAVPPEGAGAGGAGNGTEPRHTVAWTTLPQRPDTDAESIADWVRDTAAHAARARVDDLSGAPADFGAAVTQSPLLWVVLFVARGDAASRWHVSPILTPDDLPGRPHRGRPLLPGPRSPAPLAPFLAGAPRAASSRPPSSASRASSPATPASASASSTARRAAPHRGTAAASRSCLRPAVSRRGPEGADAPPFLMSPPHDKNSARGRCV